MAGRTRSRKEREIRERAIEERARRRLHDESTMPRRMRPAPPGSQLHRVARLLPGDKLRSERDALELARGMPWFLYGAGVTYLGWDARYYVWASRAAA